MWQFNEAAKSSQPRLGASLVYFKISYKYSLFDWILIEANKIFLELKMV